MISKIFSIGLIIGIGFTCLMMFNSAGEFLVINEKPIKSDVIIVLSGGGIERLEKGVELYKNGFAPFLMISNGQEDNLFEAAKMMGVPEESIILEIEAKSTTENALFTVNLMSEHEFKSAIVVSSNYHMRRVKSNYTKVIANRVKHLSYVSVSDNDYDPHRWWATRGDSRTTIIEYTKLIGNFLGFHGDEAKQKLNKVTSL